jgi:hypothetical protein
MGDRDHEERGKRAVKTTIVGGQPPGNDRSLPPVPVGIEELLGMAAVNADFARALRDDRGAAVRASGVALTSTEADILAAIDARTLTTMIGNVGGGVPNRDRRAFLQRASAALLVLAGGGAVAAAASCGGERSPKYHNDVAGGARPDYPPVEPPMDDAGPCDAGPPDAGPSDAASAADRPPPPSPTRGISPDRPEPPPATRGISPDRPTPPTGHSAIRPPRREQPIAGLMVPSEPDDE